MHLKAFYVDEETIYAALDAEQAAVLYEQDTGIACDENEYPREVTKDELDAERPALDEDERLTGATTTLRSWLRGATAPGLLAAAAR